MKSASIKEFLKVAIASLVAVGMFGVLLLTANHLVFGAATSQEATISLPVYVSVPESNLPTPGNQARNMAVIDLSMGEINPLALSPEEVAEIGAKYIYNIFGVCIDGMYVEVDFMDRGVFSTRSFWRGYVSVNNRNTLERRAAQGELIENFLRENPEGSEGWYAHKNDRSFVDLGQYFEFIPEDFYFIIDAVTGEWIDIAHRAAEMRGRTSEETLAIRQAAMEQNIDIARFGDVNLDNEEKNELVRVASYYGQRQFASTTVVDVELLRAFTDFALDDSGNIIIVPGRANFMVTDNTGRVAGISICMLTMQVTSISTMRNDMVSPSELDLEGIEDARLGAAEY